MNKNYTILKKAFNHMIAIKENEPLYETGGLLLGKIYISEIRVVEVTGPGEKAVKQKHYVIFDKDDLFNQIKPKIERGLYVLGTWHTHPDNTHLYPSFIDLVTMQHIYDCYKGLIAPLFCILMFRSDVPHIILNFESKVA